MGKYSCVNYRTVLYFCAFFIHLESEFIEAEGFIWKFNGITKAISFGGLGRLMSESGAEQM